tara:strand:+ start:731 stop:1030 length:300 start_codon:yes stop_codon:yes gene_type:complete
MESDKVCLLIENWAEITKIHEIIAKWSREGTAAQIVKENYVPIHPEYVFRDNGKWSGWNDFLGMNKETEEGKKNSFADKLENIAWDIVKEVYRNKEITT